MKTTLSFILILSGLFLFSCRPAERNMADNKIVIGTIDSLYSTILGEQRKIWVYVPTQNSMGARQTFPVIYLLDGDAHFYSVMGIIQQLSEVNMNMVLPQMILVGIPNTNRTRDLTPTHIRADMEMDSASLSVSGGGEAFTAFMEKELIPYIDSAYPAAPYRALIGHSYGGLMVMNTLLSHTGLFNAYLAVDPSMWWDNGKLLEETRTALEEKDFSGQSLYVAIANTMMPNQDTASIRSDTLFTTRHIRANLELINLLSQSPKNNFRCRWKYYEDDNHGSVPLIATYDGLRFLFDYYDPHLPYWDFMKPGYKVDSFVIAHFEKVSVKMNYRFLPPESWVNWLGYMFISFRDYHKALGLFTLNTDNYPASGNAFDSRGEAQLLLGDTLSAVKSYEMSLQLNPGNENAKNILKKIR